MTYYMALQVEGRKGKTEESMMGGGGEVYK
jgi:hypothetical protein